MSNLMEFRKIIDQAHRDDNEDPEKRWMVQHARTIEVADLIDKGSLLTHSELEILTTLSNQNKEMLFKDLQENSRLSQGMLSRYIARLARKKLIEKYHTKENKKSVVLRVTDQGREIGELHKELHQVQDKRYEELLNKYSEDEINTVIGFLKDVIKTRKEL